MEDLDSTNVPTSPLGCGGPIVFPPRTADADRNAGKSPCDPHHSVGHSGALSSQETTADLSNAVQLTLIRARSDWQLLDLRELYAFRDLLRFLIKREIKVRYAQSAIGVGWAVLQPLFTMLIFTVVFGRLARVSSDGIPYALLSIVGLVPWMYFSNGVTDGVNSLIANAPMLSKVYFPRLFLPLSAVAARFVDFAVASPIMIGMMTWYGVAPNWGLLALPWILALMMISAAGAACWLSTFAIQFRDVKHALSFVVQILMYAAPVVYPASLIPERYQLIYAVNPLVAVIEGLRAALLGTRDMPWAFLAIGTVSALLLASSGMLYFNRKQRSFADVA